MRKTGIIKSVFLSLSLVWVFMACGPAAEQEEITDVIVYGGTSGAVTAAIQAKKWGNQ